MRNAPHAATHQRQTQNAARRTANSTRDIQIGDAVAEIRIGGTLAQNLAALHPNRAEGHEHHEHQQGFARVPVDLGEQKQGRERGEAKRSESNERENLNSFHPLIVALLAPAKPLIA